MTNWILENNAKYLREHEGEEPREIRKYPSRKTAIVTCMDARLNRMLPDALGIDDGDAVVIRNAGGFISDPFGDTMRSLVIAIYELGVTDVVFVGHSDCGAREVKPDLVRRKMLVRGIPGNLLSDPVLDDWLYGVPSPAQAVLMSMDLVRNHPFVPDDVSIHGYVMNIGTGELYDVGAS